jgi:hypothetical protein
MKESHLSAIQNLLVEPAPAEPRTKIQQLSDSALSSSNLEAGVGSSLQGQRDKKNEPQPSVLAHCHD